MSAPRLCRDCGSNDCTVQVYAGNVALCDACLVKLQRGGPVVRQRSLAADLEDMSPGDFLQFVAQLASSTARAKKRPTRGELRELAGHKFGLALGNVPQ